MCYVLSKYWEINHVTNIMDRYKSFPDTFNSFYVKISKHEVCKFQNLRPIINLIKIQPKKSSH